jgi:putative nucleotidyltransferase with HDIG domain
VAPTHISETITRAITLLRAFVVASAILLAAAAIVLSSVLTRAVRDQALDDARVSLTDYTNGVLHRQIAHGGRIVVGPAAQDVVHTSLAARSDILSVKVWRPDGVLAWTNLAPERIGTKFQMSENLTEVIEHGQARAEIEEPGSDSAETVAEAQLGHDHLLEVYAPVVDGGYTIGAFEIYADPSRVESAITAKKHVIWLATFGVFFIVWALLVLLVRGASKMLRGQTEQLRKRSKDLMAAYARLEESSLEAIESLNATVEAKDPYTAGHSLRVQRIAVAIGEQLDLSKERLDALRLGALFHDIGKLGVPDALLTKPGDLSDNEFALLRRHSEEGARIVSKFGPLRATVPMILHHHERWDGTGYPYGIAGETIPLEAAIIGLADAWDAMTTDRPYHRALSLEDAFAEVRAGRESQFAPMVVDAFFTAQRKGAAGLRPEQREEEEPVAADKPHLKAVS